MRRKKLVTLLCTLVLWNISGLDLLIAQGVGQWKTYFANTAILGLAPVGDQIYGAMSTELVYVDMRDNTFSQFSKKQGLSSVGISAVGSHPSGKIIVGYQDGNIDIISGKEVYNLPEVKNKNIIGSKKINRIFSDGKYAYLACGFGIVVLDISKIEIKETYFIGPNNTAMEVLDVKTDANYIYASTESGFIYALKNAPNLNDFSVWKKEAFFTGKKVTHCAKMGNKWILSVENSNLDSENSMDVTYVGEPNQEWVPFDTANISKVSNLIGGSNYFIRCAFNKHTQRWGVEIFNAEWKSIFFVDYNGDKKIAIPYDAILDKYGNLWVASGFGYLVQYEQQTGVSHWYRKEGPISNDIFSLSHIGKYLSISAGGYSGSFAPEYTPFQVSLLMGDKWKRYDAGEEGLSKLAAYPSAIETLEDPLEAGHFFSATSTTGILEFKNDQLVAQYGPENSSLQYDMAGNGTCRTYGIAFDASGNLWVTNPMAEKALSVRKRDGSWQAYNISFLGSCDRINTILVDYWQQKWILDDNNTLRVYREKGGQIEGLHIDANYGNSLSTSNVFCFIEDDLGHIWMGTNRGIKVIDKHATIFDNPNGNISSVETKTIMVPSGEYIIELLKNDQVSAIVMDGANRKWIGTVSNGLFLVSADGTQELEHFTIDNSPLISNHITALSMDPFSGELFVANQYGLLGYRTNSTFVQEGEKAIAFPNPVRPEYNGYISIKNLPSDAIVKITDVSGNLIYQGQAIGGQLSWNGYTLSGRRPTSGVLLVFACKEDGSQKVVCKIFFIR